MKDFRRMVGIVLFIVPIVLSLSMRAANQEREQVSAKIYNADGQPVSVDEIPYTVKTRAADQRVWEKIVYEKTPYGNMLVPRKHSYTELATGLHYKDANGQWQESHEEIELLPNNTGATAQQGRHKVIFPANLANGRIEINMADGNWLRSQVMGLSYYDTESGRSVLITELTNTTGELQPPNVVVYPNAFTDLKADVRYTYTKAGFEQDVLLKEQPPSPAEFGLNPATTHLQVLTEFFDTPTPQAKGETLDFGAMKMVQGRAFLTGDTTDSRNVRVAKSWNTLEGRTFLTEEVEFKKIEPQMRQLPVATIAALRQPQIHLGKIPLLPVQRVVKQSGDAFRVADAKQKPLSVFVLDYSIVNGSVSNFIFQGDTTYQISDNFYVDYTATFEGGTIIKFSAGKNLQLFGDIVCLTAPYRPAVFTAKDDDTAGEVISGSTGNPTNYYGSFIYVEVNPVLHDLRLSHMDSCFLANDTLIITNIQAVHCNRFYYGSDTTTCRIDNGLFYKIGSFVPAADIDFTGNHLTVDICSNFSNLTLSGDTNRLHLTNCLFVNVTNWAVSNTLYFTNAVTKTNAGGIFQAAHYGLHYLTNGSPYRGAGTANIDASLLATLKNKTTYPPVVYSNMTFPTNVVFSLQAIRDTNATPDRGYHYDPVDYIFGGVISLTNMTFNPGAVAAWFPSINTNAVDTGTNNFNYVWPWGIQESDTGTVTFSGHADAHCGWVRINTVQESDVSRDRFGSPISSSVGITGRSQNMISDAAQVNATFTTFSVLGREWTSHCRDDWGRVRLAARHCEFWNGSMGQYCTSLQFTNCLLGRVTIYSIGNYHLVAGLQMWNCTMFGGNLDVEHWEGPTDWPAYGLDPDNYTNTWWVAQWPAAARNCAFDGTTITTDEPSSGTNISVMANYDFNAFLDGADQTTPTGGSSFTVTNFNWQAYALGKFYLPFSNSPLVDGGDDAATNYLLGYFTTLTNEQLEIEGLTNLVDISFHYPALDFYGRIFDVDGDGISEKPTVIITPLSQAAEANDRCGDAVVGGIKVGMLDGQNPATNVTVFFTPSGSATFSTDYFLTLTGTSTRITNNSVTISSNGPSSISIDVNPISDRLPEPDEVVTLTLSSNADYYVPIDQVSASITITNGIVFNQLSIGANIPLQVQDACGIDYSPALQSLIVSVNSKQGLGGVPFNFLRIGTNECHTMAIERWSGISNLTEEVKIAIVKTTAMGFTNSEMFFGTGTNGVVAKLSPDGTVSNLNWKILTSSTNSETLLRGSLYVDNSGSFGGDLIAVTGGGAGEGGHVWRIGCTNGQATNAFQVHNFGDNLHLEGVITLTNDPAKWGRWAGKILTGAESDTPPKIFAISSNGVVDITTNVPFANTNLGSENIAPEDFDIIPPNQDLYCCALQANCIDKLSRTLFTNYWGDLLIVQENGSSRSDLFIVRWNNSITNFQIITKICAPHQFEHVTFAPIDIPAN